MTRICGMEVAPVQGTSAPIDDAGEGPLSVSWSQTRSINPPRVEPAPMVTLPAGSPNRFSNDGPARHASSSPRSPSRGVPLPAFRRDDSTPSLTSIDRTSLVMSMPQLVGSVCSIMGDSGRASRCAVAQIACRNSRRQRGRSLASSATSVAVLPFREDASTAVAVATIAGGLPAITAPKRSAIEDASSSGAMASMPLDLSTRAVSPVASVSATTGRRLRRYS